MDYENLIQMEEHAQKFSKKLGIPVKYINDVAGSDAQEAVKSLKPGEVVLLGNLRHLTEGISTFKNAVKLELEQMLNSSNFFILVW